MQSSGDQLFKGESTYIHPNSNTLVIHQEKYKETSSRYKKKYRTPNPPNITQSTESQSLFPFISPTTSSSKQIPDIKLSKEAIISIPSELKSVSHKELIRKSISYGKKRRAPDPPDKLSRIMNSECAIQYQIHRPAPPPPVAVPVNSNRANVDTTPQDKIIPANECGRKARRKSFLDLFKVKKKKKKSTDMF